MQIFCLFFCVLCELGGKITARNAKVTQSTQVCLSKTSRPLNKSTFYIRLSALRRSGYSFPPTLRFATHWAELTRPFRALTAVSRQFRIPPWKGGERGMFISALWRVNTEVCPYMNCPFLYPVIQSTFLVIQSVSDESFLFLAGFLTVFGMTGVHVVETQIIASLRCVLRSFAKFAFGHRVPCT